MDPSAISFRTGTISPRPTVSTARRTTTTTTTETTTATGPMVLVQVRCEPEADYLNAYANCTVFPFYVTKI